MDPNTSSVKKTVAAAVVGVVVIFLLLPSLETVHVREFVNYKFVK